MRALSDLTPVLSPRRLLPRLAQAAAMLLAATLVAFSLGQTLGDPVATAVGPNASAAQRDAAAAWLGLDAPLAERYVWYLGDVARGEFGISAALGRPVGALIAGRLPATLELVGAASLLALLLGVPAGVLAAVQPRALVARALLAAARLGESLPAFLTGTLLSLVFARILHVVPAGGPPAGGGWTALVLPTLTLACAPAAALLRVVQYDMATALASGFVRFGRARGLPRAVRTRHALVNALVPAATAALPQLGVLLAYAVVAETVFQWPGAGLLLVQSIAAPDVPVLAAYLVLVALLYVALDIAADLLPSLIDPRYRLLRDRRRRFRRPPAAPTADAAPG